MKRVLNLNTAEEGFVIDDSFRYCGPTEDLVVYDGTKNGSETDRIVLKEIPFILPVPDITKCGAGKGNDCCIFITVGPNGFLCERFTSMRNTLIFKSMSAKRHPLEAYSGCMIFNSKEKEVSK